MDIRKIVFGTYCILSLNFTAKAQDYNIIDFGAVGDSKTINTESIQSAIDKCATTGGRVVVPSGTFLSGTLYMKSNVEIHVEAKGILKGSPFFRDYPVNKIHYINAFSHKADGTILLSRAFIFAEGIHNISLTGKGSLNGNGDAPEFKLGNDAISDQSKQRPCMLLIIDCKNIKVYDLLLTNSAYWLENYIGCDSLHIKGVTIYNHTNYNQDGIDIDASNVLVENCKIDVDDDGICFKSHRRGKSVENIIVRNCQVASNCNAIKFGTVSMGGLKNVSISNCRISAASEDNIRHWQQNIPFIEKPITVLSGIALESVDGAIMDNINISDIIMKDVQTPIFIVLGNRSYKAPDDTTYRQGQVRNVFIKNISATSHSKMPSSITAYPGTYVRNIILENITINNTGNGTKEDADIVLPEKTKAYPENRMYGAVYPSSGFYIRHVKDIQLNNINLKIRNKDYRPAIILDDGADVKIHSLSAIAPVGIQPLISIRKCTKIMIANVKSDTDKIMDLINTDAGEVKIK